jgi:N-acetylglucosaminyldiphosphoundecaprenol N-acetyl-beta-D-mannosaminyltransferase
MNNAQVNFIGTDVDVLTYDQLFEKCDDWLRDKHARSRHIACVNVNCAVESYLDKNVRDVFSKADVLGADSMPFVYWIKFFTGRKCDRLYAPDIILNLSKIAVHRQYRVFLYGGAEGVPEKMKCFLENRFPGINIVGTYSPPFRSLTSEEDEAICGMINATRPDYILVGLGSPKQDRWIQDHLTRIPGSIMVASGAAFDFFSGEIKQAPLYIQKSGFEWLFRLTQDPKRLWKRYTLYNFIFLWNFLMQILHLKKFKRMHASE